MNKKSLIVQKMTSKPFQTVCYFVDLSQKVVTQHHENGHSHRIEKKTTKTTKPRDEFVLKFETFRRTVVLQE